MTAVIVDPSEMREFARALRELSADIEARRRSLERQIVDVSKFWNDEKYRKFVKRQEELMLEIQYFSRKSELYCEYLRKKAFAADAYLGN